jgi:hypothetical protein
VKTPNANSNFQSSTARQWLDDMQGALNKGHRIIFNTRNLTSQQIQDLKTEVYINRKWTTSEVQFVNAS